MRFAAVLVVAVLAALVLGQQEEDVPLLFTRWMELHNKQYSSHDERDYRMTNFRASLERIRSRPQGATQWGLTKFSDMTPQEFKTHMLTYRRPPQAANLPVVQPSASAPTDVTAFDWRSKGAITWVKDQGQCGSCWAFSAVETVESYWFLAKGNLTELSPQQVVDCDHELFDSGCNGGTTQFAYDYIHTAGGLMTEDDYPYVSGDDGQRGFCVFQKKKVAASLTNWTYATPVCSDFACAHQDEKQLLSTLLSTGPVSVCLNADPWQDYVSGVLQGSDCNHKLLDVDHCVQLTGFNATSSTPYWIVRNSWGQSWGNAGFIYLQMNTNTCGVANIATVVQI